MIVRDPRSSAMTRQVTPRAAARFRASNHYGTTSMRVAVRPLCCTFTCIPFCKEPREPLLPFVDRMVRQRKRHCDVCREQIIAKQKTSTDSYFCLLPSYFLLSLQRGCPAVPMPAPREVFESDASQKSKAGRFGAMMQFP